MSHPEALYRPFWEALSCPPEDSAEIALGGALDIGFLPVARLDVVNNRIAVALLSQTAQARRFEEAFRDIIPLPQADGAMAEITRNDTETRIGFSWDVGDLQDRTLWLAHAERLRTGLEVLLETYAPHIDAYRALENLQ